jgi:hypothetical protein
MGCPADLSLQSSALRCYQRYLVLPAPGSIDNKIFENFMIENKRDSFTVTK